MKIVLLPGMDGTGILFEKLLLYLKGCEVIVLPLPNDGPQDYLFLSEYIVKLLPNEYYILVAESFSGGIAALLSQQSLSHCKGIVFVASFLSAPNRILVNIACLLPIRLFVHLPLSGFVFRFFFLGNKPSQTEIPSFLGAIKSVPQKTIKSRLKTIAKTSYDGFTSCIPVLYLKASHDRLVPNKKVKEIQKAYVNFEFSEIAGPHFILQVRPKECASEILRFCASCIKQK